MLELRKEFKKSGCRTSCAEGRRYLSEKLVAPRHGFPGEGTDRNGV